MRAGWRWLWRRKMKMRRCNWMKYIRYVSKEFRGHWFWKWMHVWSHTDTHVAEKKSVWIEQTLLLFYRWIECDWQMEPRFILLFHFNRNRSNLRKAIKNCGLTADTFIRAAVCQRYKKGARNVFRPVKMHVVSNFVGGVVLCAEKAIVDETNSRFSVWSRESSLYV